MFTRCPQCKIVHPLNAELLSHARGLVQCGDCDRTFSALSFLFDEWPSGQAHGPARGPNAVPPVLQRGSDSPDDDKEEKSEEEEPGETGIPKHLIWLGATILFVLLTISNAAWTFREQLIAIPAINDIFDDSSEDSPIDESGLLKDPAQIQLVSRDMHSHPTRSGILVLSLTFVNLADQSQVFPVLEVTLLDGGNQPVAKRRLKPEDYLRSDANITAGLAADVYLPVLLEFGDPGEQAVGFEIKFL